MVTRRTALASLATLLVPIAERSAASEGARDGD
jgi:hypothetical protein